MAGLKRALFHLLAATPRRSPGQRGFDLGLTLLILGNVAAVILDSVPALHDRYGAAFRLFDAVSMILFTLELAGRYWIADMNAQGEAAASRRRFWSDPCNLLDIAAVLPFWLGPWIGLDLRLLRLLRLVRVFRMYAWFDGLSLLGAVLREELRPMLAAFSVSAVLMLFAASGIYLLERDVQPDTFGDLPSALWWVVVTLSTVGYGDAIPATPLGRVLGAVIMMLGIGMVALPAGMLASRFSQVMHENRSRFRRLVEEQLAEHGAIPEALTDRYRQDLFISPGEADAIVAECRREAAQPMRYCPNCGVELPRMRGHDD